ncbi:MAG: GNAT family N-acetyltransferase [Clostridia bacterium]|nr:GNAT family N-acetyltransferase [Clostridia bacterium]
MCHLGTRELTTQRLVLRPFKPEDGPAMFRNWAGSSRVTRYLTWPTHDSEATSSALTTLWAKEAEDPGRYQWAIVLKELGEPIGSISVVSHDESIRAAEIGYCIGEHWWGKSLTAEALQAVILYLTESVGFNRITARHDTENPASGRVMQKAGMLFEGISRAAGRNNRGIVDMAYYGILADDVTGKKADPAQPEEAL